jgi:hypothetical protein
MTELTTTQTNSSVAGNQTGTDTSPVQQSFDWGTLDFTAAPEDVLAKVPLDKHPGARKMQSSLRKQAAQQEAKYKQELALAQEQISQMTQMIQGQMPDAADRFEQIRQKARMSQLESIVQETEAEKARRQAIDKLVETYDVDPNLLEDVEDGYDAFDRIIKADKLRYTQLDIQLKAMQSQLAALTRASNDPAASPDTRSGGTSNNYQDQYDALMKAYRGDEASKLRRKAEAEGATIDLMRWRN